jgi:hypothetical protein
MKTSLRTTILLLSLTTLAFAARAAADTTGQVTAPAGSEQDSQTLTATSARLKSFTFEQRADFSVLVKSLGAKSDAAVTGLNANYNEMQASRARRAAMEAVRTAQADFKDKIAALDTVAVETWENTKSNIVTSWENLKGAMQRARTTQD